MNIEEGHESVARIEVAAGPSLEVAAGPGLEVTAGPSWEVAQGSGQGTSLETI